MPGLLGVKDYHQNPKGKEKTPGRGLLAAGVNAQDWGGWEGCCQEAVPLMSGDETIAGAWSANHVCRALEECQLSGLASQNVSPPGHTDASVSGTFGRKRALGRGLLIGSVSSRFLCVSKPVLYGVSPWA